MVGQTILHYEITGKLGAGGMGVVYKARDIKLERTVALKFLPTDVAISERDKENLLREARAASALDHPNIGVIYGLEETPDHQLCIVMGYYEGETLSEKIATGLVPLRESLDLLIQIARGLSAAHARNIVHRDIKPSNIIVTKENVAKIVDFGLARVVASSSATQSLKVSGTLPYMAPEQVLGEPISPSCDVWALGVILVQILTGAHPFFRENHAAMTFAILNQPPAGLDDLPPPFRPIGYHALAKVVENRYPGAKEILADLEAVKLQMYPSGASAGPEPATLTSAISSRELKAMAANASTPRWSTVTQQQAASRRVLYIALALIILILGALLVPQVRERLVGLLSASRENHIAVLPFDNIGGDPANEAVAEGLMDSLTSELSNLSSVQQSLWVVPASVVRNRKITDPSAAARELGATMVVKGSVQRRDQVIHLTVDLIDAKTLRQVGSASLEDRAGDLGALQDEAVSRLAHLMNINMSAEMLRATGGNAAPVAYESYLKALGHMQRYDKPGNLDLAVDELKAAVQTDPNFALGYAQLGEAFRLKYQLDPNPKWIEETKAYADKAIALDNRLPAAYGTLGSLHSKLGKDELALQEFQRALQLEPRSVDALRGIANAYEKIGRVEEAEGTLKKAIALRPDYWELYSNLGSFYDKHNRYAEALAQYQKVIELTPDNGPAYSNMAAVYLDMGDPKVIPKAEAALRKSIELGPTFASYANLGNLYLSVGRYAESAEATEKALKMNDQDFRIWANLVETRRWLKQPDKAEDAENHMLQRLEETVKSQPQDAAVQSALAICYAERRLRDKSLQAINKALALAPDDPRILADAGETYDDLGDRPKALQYLQESLKKGMSMDDVKGRYTLQSILSDPNFRASGK